MLAGSDTESWRLLGLNVSNRIGGMPREVIGTCQIQACPTSVNVTTGRRLRSACEIWYSVASLASRRRSPNDRNLTSEPPLPQLAPKRVRWDQQHYSPSMEPWVSRGKPESVTEYYASGCIARPPLCTCSSVLSDDCVTICASHWHEFVSPEVLQDPAAEGVLFDSPRFHHTGPAFRALSPTPNARHRLKLVLPSRASLLPTRSALQQNTQSSLSA